MRELSLNVFGPAPKRPAAQSNHRCSPGKVFWCCLSVAEIRPDCGEGFGSLIQKRNAISRFASAPTLKTLGKNEANSK
jgi:hypothetical protein